MAQKNTILGLPIALVAVALIGLALYGNGQGWFNQTPTTGSVNQPGTGTQPGTLLTGNPSLSVTVLDEKTQSVLNEATVRLLDSQGQLRATANTTSGVASFTALDPNTTYTMEVLPLGGGNTAFYALSTSVTSPSAGPKTQVVTYKSATTSAPTVTVYNSDGLTANSNSAAQAIGASESVTFRIRIRPGSGTNDNNYFGDGVGGLLFAVDYNSLAISQLTMTETGGASLNPGLAPAGHQVQDVNKSATAFFVTGAKALAPNTDTDFYLTVKGSSTTQPVTNGVDDEMYVTAYDGCRIQNTLNGQYGTYWRNPVDNSNICSANAVSAIDYT